MAKPRRSRSNPKLSFDPAILLRDLQENVNREVIGLTIFAVGGYFGLSLLVDGDTALLAQLAGWTATWIALGLLGLGTVLMLGERVGYWNPQAIVGGELTLLALFTGSFVWVHDQANWMAAPRNESGGWLGWGLGNLLVGTLGRWPAALLVLILLGMGVYLLFRHTPLVYLTPYGRAIWQFLRQSLPALPVREEAPSLPQPVPRKMTAPAPRAATVSTPPAPADPVIAAAPVAAAPSAPPKATHNQPPAPPPVQLQRMRQSNSLPLMTLLEKDPGRYGSLDTKRTEELIQQTLADFDIPVRVVNVESGPTVTQYGLEPLYTERAGQKRKVRVSRIVNLADDLALALAAPSVRIEAPVPGHPYVGVEVPNTDKALVGMRDILESPEFGKNGGVLPLALGRDTAGLPVTTDLSRAPHLLIAGATGSGKSVCINSVIVSLLMHHGPESLRFVMIDPKMVELPGYNGIPHLIGKVITEMDQVVGALTWLLLQMDDRYQRFREARVRNIASYNEKAQDKQRDAALPLHCPCGG